MHTNVCVLDEHTRVCTHICVSVGGIGGCECVYLFVSLCVLRMSLIQGELGAEVAFIR